MFLAWRKLTVDDLSDCSGSLASDHYNGQVKWDGRSLAISTILIEYAACSDWVRASGQGRLSSVSTSKSERLRLSASQSSSLIRIGKPNEAEL